MATIDELHTKRENLEKLIAQLLVLRGWSHQPELFDGDITMYSLRLNEVYKELKERIGWSHSVQQ
jgi:hypothetical protein